MLFCLSLIGYVASDIIEKVDKSKPYIKFKVYVPDISGSDGNWVIVAKQGTVKSNNLHFIRNGAIVFVRGKAKPGIFIDESGSRVAHINVNANEIINCNPGIDLSNVDIRTPITVHLQNDDLP